jgi:hypothetical protein
VHPCNLPVGLEQRLQIGFRRLEGHVSHKQILHARPSQAGAVIRGTRQRAVRQILQFNSGSIRAGTLEPSPAIIPRTAGTQVRTCSLPRLAKTGTLRFTNG